MDISSQLDHLNAHLEATGLEKASLGGECPVECEGIIDGWYLYFRARNNRWRCCIAPTPRGAVGGENPSVEIYGIYGKTTENGEASDKPVDRFGAGYMAYDVAVKIIEAAIVMFRLNIEMKLQEGIDREQESCDVEFCVCGIPMTSENHNGRHTPLKEVTNDQD